MKLPIKKFKYNQRRKSFCDKILQETVSKIGMTDWEFFTWDEPDFCFKGGYFPFGTWSSFCIDRNEIELNNAKQLRQLIKTRLLDSLYDMQNLIQENIIKLENKLGGRNGSNA